MSLVIIGGTGIDVIFTRAPRLPVWPSHTEFTDANLVLLREAPVVTLGGNGGNAGLVAARCGAQVRLLTNLGSDAFGDLASHWLDNAGCRLLRPRRTGRTAVNVTAAGARLQRATLYYPANAPSLPKPGELPKDLSHLLVCGWPHPPFRPLAKFLAIVAGRNIFTALDAGPFLKGRWTLAALQPVLSSVRLFLVNEYELNAITETSGREESLARLRRIFSGHIVLKRGARGACWLPENSQERRDIAPVGAKAINTVGAGDSFNGALLARLTLGSDFPRALAFAAKMAARVVASPRGVLGV